MLSELAAAGVNAWPESRQSFATDAGHSIFLSFRSRPPTPTDIERDLQRAGDDWMLYQVRSMSQSLRRAVVSNGRLVVWDDETSTLWLNREAHREEPAAAPRQRGRRPYARLAIARSLVLDPRPRRQAEIASELGVPQSGVSHALEHLKREGGLVDRVDGGYVATDALTLWEHVVHKYPGPGGITTYWWHDASLEDQAHLVVKRAAALLSGDLAARTIAPWRQPEHVTLYLGEGLDPSALGFAMGSPDDYTMSITVPDDLMVFATAGRYGSPAGSVDPVMAAYDVLATGTTGDQQEAAERLRDTVLQRRGSST